MKLAIIGMLILYPVFTSATGNNFNFYPRSTSANQDLGGINQNFQSMSAKSRNKLTDVITPASCLSNQVLANAYFQNGTIAGGNCESVVGTAISNTYTNSNIYNSTVTFNSALVIQNLTLSALQTLAPVHLFQIVGCTTCSPPKMLIATGTSAGNWADPTGGLFK